MKDQLDVGSFSGQVTFKLVSDSLQIGLRFFQPPKPAYP